MISTKQETENKLGMVITNEQYEKAISLAKSKLKYIIHVFGDGEGERLKDYYLQNLIYEAIVHGFFLDAMFEEVNDRYEKRVPGKPEHPKR